MSFDLAAIRTAFVSNLTLPGITVAEAYDGSQTLPFGCLGTPEDGTYSRDFGGTKVQQIPFHLCVDRADIEAARRQLDAAISIGVAGSVYTAIRTVADMPDMPWRQLTVLDHSPIGTIEFGAAKALAVAFNLKFYA